MDSRTSEDTQARFNVTRRGYDPQQVDEHIATMETRIRDLEERVRLAGIQTEKLHQKLSAPSVAEDAVSAAYVAAADAKQRLLDHARRKADDIIREAEARARRIAGDAPERLVLADPSSEAEEEAKRIIHEARAEADRMIARSRTEALAAVATAQREVETLITRNRDGYTHLVSQLQALKAAVDEAVDRAERQSRVFELPPLREPSAIEA
jgi:cell division septum initiation protein DivIVA